MTKDSTVRERNPEFSSDVTKDANGPKHRAPFNPNYSSSFDEFADCDSEARKDLPPCEGKRIPPPGGDRPEQP